MFEHDIQTVIEDIQTIQKYICERGNEPPIGDTKRDENRKSRIVK